MISLYQLHGSDLKYDLKEFLFCFVNYFVITTDNLSQRLISFHRSRRIEFRPLSLKPSLHDIVSKQPLLFSITEAVLGLNSLAKDTFQIRSINQTQQTQCFIFNSTNFVHFSIEYLFIDGESSNTNFNIDLICLLFFL